MQTGDVAAKKQPIRENLRKLDDHHELMIVGLVLEQPQLYLREIRQHIADTTWVEVSDATVCRVLQKHGLTRQKMRQVTLQRCSELRARFMAETCCFSADKFGRNRVRQKDSNTEERIWIERCHTRVP